MSIKRDPAHFFHKCATPKEFRELTVDGRKVCATCERLKQANKKCLRCGKKFTPTCRYPHVCYSCVVANRRVMDGELKVIL